MSEMRNGSHGAIARALLWVGLGLMGAVAAFVAITPELAGNEPRLLIDPIVLVLAAAVPGLILLGLAAVRRKRLGLDDPDRDAQDRLALERRLHDLGHDGYDQHDHGHDDHTHGGG